MARTSKGKYFILMEAATEEIVGEGDSPTLGKLVGVNKGHITGVANNRVAIKYKYLVGKVENDNREETLGELRSRCRAYVKKRRRTQLNREERERAKYGKRRNRKYKIYKGGKYLGEATLKEFEEYLTYRKVDVDNLEERVRNVEFIDREYLALTECNYKRLMEGIDV